MKQLLFIVILLPVVTFTQIKVNINSGNPALPFPQFLPYTNPTDALKNLGTNSAVGVSHAEMEKTIRDAYQIMMNRAEKTGVSLGSIDCLHFKSTPDCSEGDGYAMLAAVAMADKTTFDGLWIWVHENAMNKVKRYGNCKSSTADYIYSQLPGWTNTTGGNSAADADFDIALALLCAYRQWGEFMGINDGCGSPISYKQAAIDFVKALTDTLTNTLAGTTLLSGDIGLDGYFKSGDSWGELTDWASDTARSKLPKPPASPGTIAQYADYMAPAYFTQFADFLSSIDSSAYSWNIRQFRRAAASSTWLIGQLAKADPKNLPIAGKVEVTGTTAKFSDYMWGEDFRLGWRTVLDRVWNGNPAFTWNPEIHQVESGVNAFEEEIGRRFARFIWDFRQDPWKNSCVTSVRTETMKYWGPSMLLSDISMSGVVPSSPFYFLNWLHGTGSPSAVVSQDINLMAEMYRQCEIEWDVATLGDGYLTSVPMYFHGWFRMLGMLVLTGNYTAPSRITSSANMKLYCDVNKTCAVPGEEVVYTLSYRNYGSIDAQSVVIVDTVPNGMTFVSCSEGGSYNASQRTVSWNIGTVPGFKTATGSAPTIGAVTFTATAGDAVNKQCINKASVRCNNGTGWASNEYPNTVSAVMKRNFVDIIDKPVVSDKIDKSFPALHGGRPGVRFTCSFDPQKESTMKTMRVRLFNDAQEAYIDYGNYRFSYFLYDTSTTCIQRQDSCPSGWAMKQLITEGMGKNDILFRHEKLVPGENNRGRWNQRIIVQFSDPENPQRVESLSTINQYMLMYYGISGRIHRGGKEPLRQVFYVNNSSWQPVTWNDDWSWNGSAAGTDASFGFPVTPDYADPSPDNPGIPVNQHSPKSCTISDSTVDNVLIEEWDGYTWRRVFGNVPQRIVEAAIPRMRTSTRLTINTLTQKNLTFTLSRSGNARLQLLDINGRVVATLLDEYLTAGRHAVTKPHAQGSAVHIVRLTTDEGTVCRKVMHLR